MGKLIWIIFFMVSNTHVFAQNFIFDDSAFEVQQIQKFEVLNKKNNLTRLSCAGSPLCLFVFLSPECPLCKNYSLTLNQLQKDYSSDVSIYGIIPGKAYSPETVNQFDKDYKITFPLFIDSQKALTSYLKATVTPEVVLINKAGLVIYRGAIDNWISDLGKSRAKPTNEYLKQAILQYTHQQPVSIKKIAPKGCLINEY